MARTRSILRRLAWLTVLATILLALLVGSMPVWFPWVARPVLRAFGFTFEEYRRTGFATFEIRGVQGWIEPVTIEAGQVSGWLPAGWAWHRWVHRDPAALEFTVDDWLVEIHATTPGPDPEVSRINSTLDLIDRVDNILHAARFWIPVARVGSGTVDLEGDRIEVEHGLWVGGRFTAIARLPWIHEAIRVEADFTRNGQARISGESDALRVGLEMELARAPDAWEVFGSASWLGNRFVVEGRFADLGWMPASARIIGRDLRVPGALVGLTGYGDLHATATVEWDGVRFAYESTGYAEPAEPGGTLQRPSVAWEMRGQGDLESIGLEMLHAGFPWLRVNLQEPVAFGWDGRWLSGPAQLNWRAELNRVPELDLDGKIEGRLELRTNESPWPQAWFEMDGVDLKAWGVAVAHSQAVGNLRWPLLEVQSVQVHFADGSQLDARAGLNLEDRCLEWGGWHYEGTMVDWSLPDGIGLRQVHSNGSAHGPFNRLFHTGTARATGIATRGLCTADLQLDWQGEGFAVSSIDARWETEDSRLDLEAAFEVVELTPLTLWARIADMTLTQDDKVRYQLAQPCQIDWRHVPANPDDATTVQADWQLAFEPFRWEGPNRALVAEGELDWPQRGHLTARAAGLELKHFLGLLPWPDWGVVLQQAKLIAAWDGSAVSFESNWNGTAMGPEDVSLALTGRIRGDRLGLIIDEITASTAAAPMLTVEGRVPAFLQPGATNGWLQFDPERAFHVHAMTDATGLITIPAGNAGDLLLLDPIMDLHVQGPATQPEGHVHAELSRIEWRSTTGALSAPALERVELEFVLEQDHLQVTRLQMEVHGQPIRVTGLWPLGVQAWQALLQHGRLPDWKRASAEVQIADARVAPFARYLPELLSPQGRIDANLILRPGPRFDGDLTITNVATRPIGPLTPARDIEVHMRFHDRQAIIERFTGQIGGQPVAVSGAIELTEPGLPAFELEFTGRNVPLVRRPGFLLRSDLALRLESAPDQTTRLTGDVQLRDGLFLQDIASLVAGRLERPPLRPPYFSVTNVPFADWHLDLQVQGEQFLRVRMPVFIGMISATGRLRGTMREPVVTGDARIDSGRVIFPFGTLSVDQGHATLRETDLRGPVLAVIASSRNYGYHVRLELDGPVDEPSIVFTSTPPLTSEEILLMLTAGELPQHEIVYSTQARAGRLATYLGREMVLRFVGDEMAEARIVINPGENIAADGRTTYSIEYRLHPRWSLVGEYDRFNALNAGVKWRVYTR